MKKSTETLSAHDSSDKNEMKLSPKSTCHICRELSDDHITCSTPTCNTIFCIKCTEKKLTDKPEVLNKIKEDKNNFICFICKAQCSCKPCQDKFSKQTNIISINLADGLGKNNMVKIDDFLIYENAGDELDDIEVNEVKDGPTRPPASGSRIDQQKINNIITNVEQFSYKTSFNKNLPRQCCVCLKDDLMLTELLKFRTVEEFVIYFKFVFENRSSIYKTNEIIFESNKENMNKVIRNLHKVLKQGLKTTKYLCKNCLFSKLNEEDGISKLCHCLDLNTVMMLYESMNKPLFTTTSMSSKITPSPKESMPIIPQTIRLPGMPIMPESEPKDNNFDNIANIENTINMILNNGDNSNPAMLQKLIDNLNTNLPINSNALNSLSANFGKMAETISNMNAGNLNRNNQVVNSVGNLVNVLNTMGENKHDNDTFKDLTSDKKDGDGKDDMMNVTNIIMNFEQNKNPIISYVVSVLEDLKKQIVSIQYYSLLQKLFISYIFKNLENFNDQVTSANQTSDKQEQSKKLNDDIKQLEILKSMAKPNMNMNMSNSQSSVSTQNKPANNNTNNNNGGGFMPNQGNMSNPLLDQMLKMKMNPMQFNQGGQQMPMNPMNHPLMMSLGGMMPNPLMMGSNSFNPMHLLQSLGTQGMNPLQNPLINPQLMQLLSQNGINSMLQGGDKMMGGNPLFSMLQGRGDPNLMNMLNKYQVINFRDQSNNPLNLGMGLNPNIPGLGNLNQLGMNPLNPMNSFGNLGGLPNMSNIPGLNLNPLNQMGQMGNMGGNMFESSKF
jgi:hypothetical protein